MCNCTKFWCDWKTADEMWISFVPEDAMKQHSILFIYESFAAFLWWVLCGWPRLPIQPLCHSASSRGQGEKRRWKGSWLEVKVGRSLTDGRPGQSRLGLHKTVVSYCQLKLDGEKQRHRLEHLSPRPQLCCGLGPALRWAPASPHGGPRSPHSPAWAPQPRAVRACRLI